MRLKFWRTCRVCFRWCRVSLLLLILAAAWVLLWFNLVGLPTFLKEPLLANLQQRGIHVEFSRMRLRMRRGIVAENVRVGDAQNPDQPTLSVGEVQLLLNFEGLLRGHLQVQGLVLREGRLVVPVNGTNQPPDTLELTNIQTDLRFQENNTWSLDNFQADFKGAKLSLNGDLAHAPEILNWEIFRGRPAGGPENWQAQVQQISAVLAKIHLPGTPRLNLNIDGDARDPHLFVIRLQGSANSVQTPWFGARDLQFSARLTAPAGAPANSILWPESWGNAQPYRLVWSTHFTRLKAEAMRADAVVASGVWQASELALNLHLQGAAYTNNTHRVAAQTMELIARLAAPTLAVTNPPLSGLWSNLQPYRLAWSTRISRLHVDEINAEEVAAGGCWQAPQLVVTNLTVGLGGGRLEANLQYDVAGRKLEFTSSSAFDLQAVTALLTDTMRARLGLFTWTQPPTLQVGGAVDLSSWHVGDVKPPAIFLSGELAFTNAAMLGVQLDWVQTHFSYSNLVWQLPDLQVERQKTRLQLAGAEDETTKLFNAHIQGRFDVDQIRPWLKSKVAVREVGRLSFHQPLVLDLTVGGLLHDVGALNAAGHLALTNFAARGGSVDSLVTDLHYTNGVIEFFHPETWRANGAQTLTADKVVLNLKEMRIYFVNGFSTTDPQVVANSIGPKTGRTMEPYQFLTPPTAWVNGYVSLLSSEDNQQLTEADLQVDIVKGAPFSWLKFNTRDLAGTAHWFGGTLLLTNVNAEFYDGRATGVAQFDFRSRVGTGYTFAFDVTKTSLHRLIAGLANPTNKLEGALGGRFVVTRANSTDWRLMDGYGDATLRDGLIWDAPIFGIFSPVLNRISPGLGSSRATDAKALFTMTNGVVYSDSLEIHSTLVRLQYVGTVDMQEKLDARVTAQPLRDTWGVGTLINNVIWPVTKLFEYKVTGTLDDPQSTPLYDISKLILLPLHPIKTLEGILPADTNSPAVKLPKKAGGGPGVN